MESISDLRKIPLDRDDSIVEDENQLTQVIDCETLKILDRQDGWLYVEAFYQPAYTEGEGWHGYRGWIEATEVEGRSLCGLTTRGHALSLACAPEPQQRAYIVERLRSFLDTPYLWGGLSQAGIDCSGLVHLAYRRAGYCIPRDACDQRRLCHLVEPKKLLPADLLFLSDAGKTTHVMAYGGGDSLIEAILELGCVREVGVEERLGAPLHAVGQGHRLPSGKRCYAAALFAPSKQS